METPYVETREFTLRLELRCTFPPSYEGELDGFAWVEEFRARIAPAVTAAAARAIRAHPGWTVRPGNRGRAPDDEVTLVVERTPGD
jgi:hypothetical protein